MPGFPSRPTPVDPALGNSDVQLPEATAAGCTGAAPPGGSIRRATRAAQARGTRVPIRATVRIVRATGGRSAEDPTPPYEPAPENGRPELRSGTRLRPPPVGGFAYRRYRKWMVDGWPRWAPSATR